MHPTEQTYNISIPILLQGQRLDKALAELIPDLSRSRIQALIEEGHVFLGQSPIQNPAAKVKAEQSYYIHIPPSAPAEPLAQEIPLNIVYEDNSLLVIDKPADMVVHPGAGNQDQTLVNALLHHCGESLSGIGGVKRPGIVHRLDKDTSGLMVVAKTDQAHQFLSNQFDSRQISRTYQALVWGIPSPTEGRIEGNIGRHPIDRKKMALVAKGGKSAITLYKVLKNFGMIASLIECKLLTGRTHQIRVHLSSKGWPLIGDPVYGHPPRTVWQKIPLEQRKYIECFPRQALHAISLSFIHPETQERMNLSSPLPQDFQDLMKTLDSMGKHL